MADIGKVLFRVITEFVIYIFFGRGRWTVGPSSKSRKSCHAMSSCDQPKSFK